MQKIAVSSIFVLVAGSVGIAEVAQSQAPIPVGAEFQVNTYTTYDQERPSVAMAENGNFVVVWESYRQDGSVESVQGQRFNFAGAAVGEEFQVNSTTLGDQYLPAIAMDGVGNFVVAWSASGQGLDYTSVRGQRFDSTGTKVGGEFQINSYTTYRQFRPSVAMNEIGDFVVVWVSSGQDGSNHSVHGQSFDATGAALGNEFQANSYTMYAQSQPSVEIGENGDFVVVWQSDGQDGSSRSVHGQLFQPSGTPLNGEFQINDFTTGFQSYPVAALDNSGNFFVAWSSFGPDGDSGGIQGRRFDSGGVAVGGEFQVNTYTTGTQTRPWVAEDGAGNFTVVWQSYGQYGNTSSSVHGQVVRGDGFVSGEEFQVDAYTTSDSGFPRVAQDGNGRIVVVWQSPGADGSFDTVQGRRFQMPTIFVDGFESGGTSAWSSTVP